jgi:CGNR zinc finger
LPYRVVVLRTARDQLRDAPPSCRATWTASPRCSAWTPTATAAFQVRVVDDDDDYREAIFAGGRGIVGCWCSMDRCGNRAKVRAFRDRRQQHEEEAP